jgi:hypothetical protein
MVCDNEPQQRAPDRRKNTREGTSQCIRTVKRRHDAVLAPPSPIHTPIHVRAASRAVNVNRRERVKPGTFEDRDGPRWAPEAATRCGSGLRGRLDALAPCRLVLLSEAHLKQATSPSSRSVSAALQRSWRLSTNRSRGFMLNGPTTRRLAMPAVPN